MRRKKRQRIPSKAYQYGYAVAVKGKQPHNWFKPTISDGRGKQAPNHRWHDYNNGYLAGLSDNNISDLL